MRTNVLIVGGGIAGLYAALNFPDNISVTLICKNDLTISNSSLAQGGIAAVLDEENDSPTEHIQDTLRAGKFENNLAHLKIMVDEGPADIEKLLSCGVNFTSVQNKLLLTLEGGHTKKRVAFHKDSTGREIIEKLIIAVKNRPNVKILPYSTLLNLTKIENGFNALVSHDKKVLQLQSNYVVLATGGVGRAYQFTTNSPVSTGDGIMFAHKLGAKISDMGAIQFHPTACTLGRERFLMSEAVRGEGALLLNVKRERFMHKYHDSLELAPRDVVSKAIIDESHATGSQDFYLDISHRDATFVKERFPNIYKRCLQNGVDITREAAPIFPCQHYIMGGICTDAYGLTSVDRLFAVGECANTGVHGANRLASNSLLEGLVFARRAAQKITKLDDFLDLQEPSCAVDTSGKTLPTGIRTQIRKILQASYFVTRNKQKAVDGLLLIDKILTDLTAQNYTLNRDFIEAFSIATIAKMILEEM